MAEQLRGASQINDTEFLAAYNDQTKNNQGVIDALNTDWTAVNVKLRSARVMLHTLVERTGGKSGTFTVRSSPALEALIWQRYATVQSQPKSGPYVSLADRIAKGVITVDTESLVVTETTPSAAPANTPAPTESSSATATAPSTGTSAAVPATPAAVAFAFAAEIYGDTYSFEGEDREAAIGALFTKLQELNFSKVAITRTDTHQPCGINDIVNGGSYKFAKQLTAA